MTHEYSYKGTLTDVKKINDLLLYLKDLGSMAEQICFNFEDRENCLKEYNGFYTGNIAIKKEFVFENSESKPSLEAIEASKLKFKNELIIAHAKVGENLSDNQLEEMCEKFFAKLFFLDKINVIGLVYRYSTDPADLFSQDDYDSISSHSFVFLLDAYIDCHKITLKKNNMIEIFKKQDSWLGEYLALDFSVSNPYFLYRHYSINEILDLYRWIKSFFIKDFTATSFYSDYDFKLPKQTKKLTIDDMNKGYKIVRKKFKEKCIYYRTWHEYYQSPKKNDITDEERDAIRIDIEIELTKKYKTL